MTDQFDIAQGLQLRPLPFDVAQQFQGRVVKEIVREPPIGGWNTRDALDNMPSTDALILENWFPDLGSMISRGGSTFWNDCDPTHTSQTTNPVESLLSLDSRGQKKILACCNNKWYDVTSKNSATFIQAYEGEPGSETTRTLTSSRWQWVNYNGAIIMTCGVGGEQPLIYDPNDVYKSGGEDSYEEDLFSPPFTGTGGDTIDEGTIIGCHSYKNRMYYWTVDSQDFWYTDLGAAYGNVTKFPLSRVTTLGGNLIAMHTWTHDGGAGPDDFAVFMLSSGQCVVYQGTSPSSVGNWSIVGVYDIGIPVGVRGATKYGGDLVVMTSLDWVKMSEVVSGFEARETRTKISGAAKHAVMAYSGNYGWQALTHAAGKKLIFNVPTSSYTSEQHIMNMVTGAWTKFTGWNAKCFVSHRDELYYGCVDGCVYKCDTGADDEAMVTFNPRGWAKFSIQTRVQSAWDRMDSAPNKTFEAMDIVYEAEEGVEKSIAFATEYGSFDSTLYPDAKNRQLIKWTDNITWHGTQVDSTGVSGLDDFRSDATLFTGNEGDTFTIEIDETGSPNTFKWKKNSGSYTSSVSITGGWQGLSDGFSVKFDSTDGHTLADEWIVTIPYVPVLAWSDPEIIIRGWDLIWGYGRTFSYEMKMSLKQDVTWLSNHFLYYEGNRL